MPDSTPRLGLPWLMPAQARKHVTVNEALGRLDAITGAAVASRTLATQPSDPAEGDAYILPAGAAGSAWTDFYAHDLAYFQDGAWMRIAARTGLTAHVADEGALVMYDGTAWSAFTDAIATLANLQSLGVGTAPNAANPFAAKLNAALWTARYDSEGGTGDLRYVMNKESAGDTLSVVFQSAYSGRAELGLAGSDDLSVKVSSDGAQWTEALSIAKADGRVSVPRADIGALAALNSGALGGFRNALINGDFTRWSRGTAVTPTGAQFYAADGVFVAQTGQGGALRSGDVPDAEGFAGSLEFGAGTATYPLAGQRVERAIALTLAARLVTISFWAKSVSGTATLSCQVRSADVEDDFSAVTDRHFQVLSQAPSTLWTRYTFTTSLHPSCARGFELLFVRNNVSPATTRITGLQLEPGPQATPFEHRAPVVEQGLCARYFERRTVRTQNGSRHIALAPKRIPPLLSLSAGTASHVTETGFELTHTAQADCLIDASAEL